MTKPPIQNNLLLSPREIFSASLISFSALIASIFASTTMASKLSNYQKNILLKLSPCFSTSIDIEFEISLT